VLRAGHLPPPLGVPTETIAKVTESDLVVPIGTTVDERNAAELSREATSARHRAETGSG